MRLRSTGQAMHDLARLGSRETCLSSPRPSSPRPSPRSQCSRGLKEASKEEATLSCCPQLGFAGLPQKAIRDAQTSPDVHRTSPGLLAALSLQPWAITAMSGANATTPTAPRGRPADSAYFRWLLPRLTTDNPPRQHSWSPPRVPAPSTAPSTPRDVSWERRSRGNSLDYSPVDHRRQSSWGNVRSPTTAMSSRSRLRHSGLSRERHASGEITPDEESDDDPDGDADDDGEEGSGGRDLRGSTIAYRDYDSHVPSVNGGGPQSSKGRTQKRGVEVNGSCPEEEPSIRGRSQALQQSPRNARTRRRALLPDWLTGYHSPSEQNGRDQRSHDHGSPILAKLKPKNAPEALSFLKLDAKLKAATNLHPDLERKESEPKFPTHQFHPVLILENSGSVARDHLANERTFLAYVRTSLSIASTGVGERLLHPLPIRSSLIIRSLQIMKVSSSSSHFLWPI